LGAVELRRVTLFAGREIFGCEMIRGVSGRVNDRVRTVVAQV
jgi:hypothetical protein